MESMPIPHYIDNPAQWLWWETDEVVPIAIMISMGMIFHMLTISLFASWGFFKLYVYFKNRHLRGYLDHIAYRIGLVPLNKRFQNGAITFYHA